MLRRMEYGFGMNRKLIPCNLCGSSQWEPFVIGTDRLHGFEGRFMYVRCSQCGLVFMNPPISPEEIGRYYPDDYAPHQKTASSEDDQSRINLPRAIIQQLSADSKVLDIGCGSGSFLHALRQKTGCQIFGLDLSDNAVRAARRNYGIRVFCGTLEGYPGDENTFDLITAWSFLEHVHDPMNVLTKVHHLMKPGGWFCMKTPNIRSLNAYFFKEKWYPLDCPRHLFLFSPSTIRRYCQKTGLHIQSITWDKSSKTLLCSLQYLFYGNNTDPETKDRIRKSKLARAILSPWAHLCGCVGLGDQMFITARKELQG